MSDDDDAREGCSNGCQEISTWRRIGAGSLWRDYGLIFTAEIEAPIDLSRRAWNVARSAGQRSARM
jgi:hypothetical protein